MLEMPCYLGQLYNKQLNIFLLYFLLDIVSGVTGKFPHCQLHWLWVFLVIEFRSKLLEGLFNNAINISVYYTLTQKYLFCEVNEYKKSSSTEWTKRIK